jgi:hypothetical protein
MNTEFHNDLDLQFRKALSVENPIAIGSEFSVPPLSQKARKLVMRRKKAAVSPVNIFGAIVAFFNLQVKFYHLGLTVLLFSAGLFYFSENVYHNSQHSDSLDAGSGMSITNATISVTSSTMLASIPTFVTRN